MQRHACLRGGESVRLMRPSRRSVLTRSMQRRACLWGGESVRLLCAPRPSAFERS